MDYIRVRLPKLVVYLTPAEIHQLLLQDKELFTEVIRRGKAFNRARSARERQSQKSVYEKRGMRSL